MDNKIFADILKLLNSSETIDYIYPELQGQLHTRFGCDALVFLLSDSADDITIYIWDTDTQKLDANTTIERSGLQPAFRSPQPAIISQIDSDSPCILDNLLYASDLQGYIAFPLVQKSQTIGTLVLAWQDFSHYQPAQFHILKEIVSAITAMLVRSLRVDQIRDTLRNTRTLYSASHSLISTESLTEILNNVVNNTTLAVGSAYCTLYVFSEENKPEIQHIATYHHPFLEPFPTLTYEQLMQGIVRNSVVNREPVRLRMGSMDLQSPFGDKLGAALIAPVVYRQQVLGILTAHKTPTQPDFVDDDLALFSSLANQAAAAIAKARLHNARKRQVQRLADLRDLSIKMQDAHSVETLISIILTELGKLFDPAVMIMNLIDHDDAVVVACKPEGIFSIGYRLPIERGITGAVARSKKLEIIHNFQQDQRISLPTTPSKLFQDLRTTVSLPLLGGENLIGVMHIAFQTIRKFDHADKTLFQAVTSLIGGALQHVLLLESLEEHVEERNQQLVFANEELQAANERLHELDKLKNRFISDVSHELRTPLTSLGLYLDLLERRPDRQAHYLSVVRNEVTRLRTLVLDVLKIARYDSGRVVTNFHTVCITDIVLREVALHRERAEAVGIEIVTKLDTNMQPMIGDDTQLAEMTTALLYNAINYTKHGKIEICMQHVPLANAMELKITDSGMGIPKDEIDHVFQRFYRGSNASMLVGSGLGLNLAEEIVHLHKGYLSLTSELGKGTSVTVLLPTIQNKEVTTEATHAASMTISR